MAKGATGPAPAAPSLADSPKPEFALFRITRQRRCGRTGEVSRCALRPQGVVTIPAGGPLPHRLGPVPLVSRAARAANPSPALGLGGEKTGQFRRGGSGRGAEPGSGESGCRVGLARRVNGLLTSAECGEERAGVGVAGAVGVDRLDAITGGAT